MVDIGVRLREARTQQGMSLRSLAQDIDVSPSLLSQIERGVTQPSLTKLHAIVLRLGLSMDELLEIPVEESDSDDTRRGPLARPIATTIGRASDNPVLIKKNGIRWERLGFTADQEMEVLRVTHAPGAVSSVEGKLARHSGIEFAYVLDGEFTIQVEHDEHVLTAGDSIQFDPLRSHLYSNRGDRTATALWLIFGRTGRDMLPGEGPKWETPAHLTSAVNVLREIDRLISSVSLA